MQSLLDRRNPSRSRQTIPISHRSFQSSSEAYTKFIESCARDRALKLGRVLHAHLIINGSSRLTHFASKLIVFYTECRRLSDARKLFDKIPQTNSRRWIVLIGAYSRRGYHREAMSVFCDMQGEGVRPNRQVETARWVFDVMAKKDVVALNAMVSGYVQHGLVKEALSLVEESRTMEVKPNVVTWNTLIAGFAQACNDSMVSEMFRSMRADGVEPDVVSYTSVISGLVQNVRNDEAFDTFKHMLGLGLHPSSATISSLLPACATTADLRRGKVIHGYAVASGVKDDVFVRSALVDMQYGNIDLAEIAAHHLHELEPDSPGSSLLLSETQTKEQISRGNKTNATKITSSIDFKNLETGKQIFLQEKGCGKGYHGINNAKQARTAALFA
ncbi:hypothetical protein U1Q18_033380 [Sarracenia purpurea var. burkii]